MHVEEILKAGISIDTRRIKPGEVFIPLKGPNFDGRDFIPQAKRKGAKVLGFKDGLKALQELASYNRRKFMIPVVGVTGSSGKTTVKDMLASILSQKYRTLKNVENLNNEIGVPLTLLKLKKSHQAAVIEMAMQNLKEIELLARITRPTIAVITNIGEAHLEFLNTKKNVARAKAEILHNLRPGEHAVLPSDDEYFKFLKKHAPKGVNLRTFGSIDAKRYKKLLKHLKLPGRHNILNALAAIQAAKILKVSNEQIRKGLERFKPSGKRMELIKKKGGILIINDSYNANPSSMRAALLTLAEYPAKRRIAVLGDMLELGKISKAAHQKIGSLSKKLKIDLLLSVGTLSNAMKADRHFENVKDASKYLKKHLRPGDVVLLKASRLIQLEKVVDNL